jgi:acetyl-CoA C-acetyltransferase/acetyl-CoA acyltransferase
MSAPRFAVFAGIRTPFGKAGGALADYAAEDLGAMAARELLLRTGIPPDAIDGVVAGNVGQSSRAANIARVIGLRAGVPQRVPAWTVHRNCASGVEAVTEAADQMTLGRGRVYLVLGVESMSNYPLEVNRRGRDFFARLSKAKSLGQRVAAFASARPSAFVPKVALLEGLTDPYVGLNMGQTAEVLAREWKISRAAQDAFAVESHRKALAAAPRLREETFDVVTKTGVLRDDEGVRPDSSTEKLAKLRPVFEKTLGTVTAGNSSQVTDGAVALLCGDPARGQELGLPVLGFVERFAYAGLDPARMGLGPVHAIDRLYPGAPIPWPSFDLVEINEAFAAQVLACLAASESSDFAKKELGRSSPLGAIPTDRLNVNGGAIALGHPVGATGTRLVLTSLLELSRRKANRALLSLCVGGGQGAALTVVRG